jgi:hypothetical protein
VALTFPSITLWWEMIPAPTFATSQTVSRQCEHFTVFVSKQSNSIILLPCNQWGGTNGKTIKINIKTKMLMNIDATNEGQYFSSFIKKKIVKNGILRPFRQHLAP